MELVKNLLEEPFNWTIADLMRWAKRLISDTVVVQTKPLITSLNFHSDVVIVSLTDGSIEATSIQRL